MNADWGKECELRDKSSHGESEVSEFDLQNVRSRGALRSACERLLAGAACDEPTAVSCMVQGSGSASKSPPDVVRPK